MASRFLKNIQFMTHRTLFYLIAFVSFFAMPAAEAKNSQTIDDCSVLLKNDTLYLQNSAIKRTWAWNEGNIITLAIEDCANGIVWDVSNTLPDLFLPGETTSSSGGTLQVEKVPASLRHTEHLRVTADCVLGDLTIRRIFKVYPNCPAIACDIYIKGNAAKTWVKPPANAADLQNIEALTANSAQGNMPILDHLSLPGRHWSIEAIEFLDITDRFNTLVRPVGELSYRDCLYRGNILFARNREKDAGFFMLKEAPTSSVQLCYPNGDFLTSENTFSMIGLGIDSTDLKKDEWTRAYGYVTGLFGSGELSQLEALRSYQTRVRPMLPERDEMIMLNTWGDRGQDTRVNEAFCLNELDLCARLGITHFQIDDGWQEGRSANSAFGGTFNNIWSNPNYWEPDKERFPNGLEPIVRRGKELGVEVCLWFNPSKQDDYADWEKDAEALIVLYRKHGIRTFKIDGMAIPNKVSEIRLRQMYDRVMTATNWKAVLNLDATAGRRGGYLFFNEYGNIFLENRYTDWGNYYPYRTLRNLWMLSRYMPPQSLQIEFLNLWRNQEKYTGDRFAPVNYSFNYAFATTMAAQPLAWFEAANLPEEAFATGNLIRAYHAIQHDLHSGYIFPIGNEPSGLSWTGFQSIKERRGYLLIYREDNPSQTHQMATWLPEGVAVELSPVLGDAPAFETQTGKDGSITFTLDQPNSFVLYEYRVR